MTLRDYYWCWAQDYLQVGDLRVEFTNLGADLVEILIADLAHYWKHDELLIKLYGRVDGVSKSENDLSCLCTRVNARLKAVGWKIEYKAGKGRQLVIAADCVARPVVGVDLGRGDRTSITVINADHSAAQPAHSAPVDGRDFIGLLSDGAQVIMRHPKSTSEYYHHWDVDGGQCVPMPKTICPDNKDEFIELIEWYAMPMASAQALAQVSGMPKSWFAVGDA